VCPSESEEVEQQRDTLYHVVDRVVVEVDTRGSTLGLRQQATLPPLVLCQQQLPTDLQSGYNDLRYSAKSEIWAAVRLRDRFVL
jgi:hypothetical protein